MTARVGDRQGKSVASASGDPNDGGDDIVGVFGHGSTIVFSSSTGTSTGPAIRGSLLSHKAKKCPGDSDFYDSRASAAHSGADAGSPPPSTADEWLRSPATGVVRTAVASSGRVLRSWSVGEGVVTRPAPGPRARSAARHDGGRLRRYRPGAKRQSRELLTDGGPPPILLGVQGDLVVYETGGALHLLRLSDGRDKALLIPGAAPWLDASLEPGGLFVSWNKMHDRRPGRIAFIPLRTIAGRL